MSPPPRIKSKLSAELQAVHSDTHFQEYVAAARDVAKEASQWGKRDVPFIDVFTALKGNDNVNNNGKPEAIREDYVFAGGLKLTGAAYGVRLHLAIFENLLLNYLTGDCPLAETVHSRNQECSGEEQTV